MIIGVIAALAIVFGGSVFSFDHVKEAADEVIDDRDRAQQVSQNHFYDECRHIFLQLNSIDPVAVQNRPPGHRDPGAHPVPALPPKCDRNEHACAGPVYTRVTPAHLQDLHHVR